MFDDRPAWRRAALPGLCVLAVLLGVYLAGGAGRQEPATSAHAPVAQALPSTR